MWGLIWPHFCFHYVMKYSILVCLATCCLMSGCNSTESVEQKTEAASSSPTISARPGKDCYRGNSGRDTITLTINHNGEKITGDLDYHFFEKDSNHGTIDGWMKGDTLIADYTFNSEGTQSVRQVAFLRDNEGLSEGYANTTDKGGKMMFSDLNELKFGSGFILKKIECSP